jgi:cation diffusion facilitator CzcD-associated flavoprotein CzcO
MANETTEVAIVGAGPYGLSAAAHLRRAGVEVRVFGRPMSFWRSMPAGMLMRSNWTATNIAELHGELSLEGYQAETGARFSAPVPLERFIEYGDWVQGKVAPDVDLRLVSRVAQRNGGFQIMLQDGEDLAAKQVVVACGIQRFAWRPPEFEGLPRSLASHTGDHSDLTNFAGKRVAVVGGGQSARECAALAHEAGAEVEVFARSRKLVWLRGVAVKKRLGRFGPIVYAPTDVGPLWYSRLVAVPDLFRQLPRRAQTRIARRSIRPAGSHWLIDRLAEVPLHLDCRVVSATPVRGKLELELSTGETRVVDHLMFGTGYRLDISRYPFLAPELIAHIRQADGYPVLSRGFESSAAGLHFLGAPAAWSFGPIMRFVSGSWYGGRMLAQQVTGNGSRPTGSAVKRRRFTVERTRAGRVERATRSG